MKKKIFLFILLGLLTLTFVSCDFFNVNTSTILTSQTIVEDTTTELVTTGSTTNSEASTEITNQSEKPIIPSDYDLLQDKLEYVGIPSVGTAKVLVFVVDFSDYPIINNDKTLSDIDIAFNGESTELDYESLNSYYLKSSYGKLDIEADIFGFYTANYPSSHYEDEYEKLWEVNPDTGDWMNDDVTYPDSNLILELMEYYDDEIDYSNYDANNDGYIDGIYIMYNHPVSFNSGSNLWWAYQDNYVYEDNIFDGKKPMYFSWTGIDFLTHSEDNLDARTIIHETGHMLGLDDYYDYYDGDDYNNSGGLGGADMMDSGYGDHNPFSKILLGWVTPIVVEDSMSVDITPFVQSGDVILLIDHWNNTIFDEYILISYYSPTGLNEADKYMTFSLPGIIIYHVSAGIGNGYSPDSHYYTIFDYNNTDTEHKLIKIIEADMDEFIDTASLAENEDLFLQGDVLSGDIYQNYKWYNDNLVIANVKVSYLDNSFATIEILFNK